MNKVKYFDVRIVKKKEEQKEENIINLHENK